MYKTILLGMLISLNACAQSPQKLKQTNMKPKINKPDEEWEKILTPQQFHILRKKGTDLPGTGQYTYHFDKGIYKCAA
ncbi:MAG TPA: peptide-methionine (R)-S-oxide reductase, partial [Flavobacteriales bacterium]|nr:peptide-methionine (R)-S-oxide reductase [Flavobacteriales bacterium]